MVGPLSALLPRTNPVFLASFHMRPKKMGCGAEVPQGGIDLVVILQDAVQQVEAEIGVDGDALVIEGGLQDNTR